MSPQSSNNRYRIYNPEPTDATPSKLPPWLRGIEKTLYLAQIKRGMPHNEEVWQRVCKLAEEAEQYYKDNPIIEPVDMVNNSNKSSNTDISFRSIELAPCPPEWQELERNKG